MRILCEAEPHMKAVSTRTLVEPSDVLNNNNKNDKNGHNRPCTRMLAYVTVFHTAYV